MSWCFLDVAGENVLTVNLTWTPLVRWRLTDIFYAVSHANATIAQRAWRDERSLYVVPIRVEWLDKLSPRKKARRGRKTRRPSS